MPHQSLKLVPGVDQNKTPALNEAAISYSNLIRFVPDRNGLGLVQKLGGWNRFSSQSFSSPIRYLHAWQALDADTYLGIGAEDTLGVIRTSGETSTFRDITPQVLIVSPVADLQTTAGSDEIRVTDVGSNIDNFDSVWIKTQLTIGGLRIQGLYRCFAVSADEYIIKSTDVLGYPLPATSSSTATGTVSFTSTSGSYSIDVTLNNHLYNLGDTATFLVPTNVGGVAIYGDYTVVSVTSANEFVINAANIANASATVPLNEGLAYYVYYNGIGPVALTTGYGVGGYGVGGYGSGSVASGFRVGDTIGTQTIASNAIISHDVNSAIPAGSVVTIAGVTPAGYNGVYTVTASTSMLSTITAAVWVSGSATITHTGPDAVLVGSAIIVSGVTPAGYNGTYIVTASTARTTVLGVTTLATVTYAIASTPGAYTSGGLVASNTFTVVNAASSGAQTVAGTFTLTSLAGITGTEDWSLDNWGENLLACPVNGGIYQWVPGAGNPVSTIIPEAPPVNDGFFVAMPQRQIVAWGSTFSGIQDPLLVRWCDVEDYFVWAGTAVNQAGSYRIPKGSKIVGGIQGPQQGLLWTDLACWAMQYIGPPYVYSFNEIGNGCGLIYHKAAASMNGVIYWMSQSQFFKLSGSGVEPIPCPVWDVIFQDLDTDNLDKIRIAPNSRFGEISWFYPTYSNGGEVSHYVKYNIALNQWDFGTLQRTAWINQSVLGPPIGAGQLPGGGEEYWLVQHETSSNAVNSSNGEVPMNSSFQTGYFTLNDGDLMTFIDEFWPDAKWGYYDGQVDGGAVYQQPSSSLLLTFYVTDYPGDTPVSYGPFTLTQATQYVTPRLRGRLVSIKIENPPNQLGSFWRIGNMRYRFQPDGRY
jgi:hypothetical protein